MYASGDMKAQLRPLHPAEKDILTSIIADLLLSVAIPELEGILNETPGEDAQNGRNHPF